MYICIMWIVGSYITQNDDVVVINDVTWQDFAVSRAGAQMNGSGILWASATRCLIGQVDNDLASYPFTASERRSRVDHQRVK